MITCLTDYIGLRNVSDDSEAPTSGIYVNDLPGISSQHFSDIVNDELDGISAEWDKIEERSIRAFETDLRSRLKKYFTGYQLISSGITGCFIYSCDPKTACSSPATCWRRCCASA